MKTLKEVCDMFGITRKTMQGYDKYELLKPNIGANGYWSYDDEAIQCLQLIQFFKEIGYTRTKIRSVLEFSDEDSDQGWQYQHAVYRAELRKHGVIQSMSRKGNCYDNSIMESFFGRLKNEMFYGFEKEYTSFELFSAAIADYIDYYNNRRIQAKTKWMPPSKFREASMMQN